jgi:hypothetical protein
MNCLFRDSLGAVKIDPMFIMMHFRFSNRCLVAGSQGDFDPPAHYVFIKLTILCRGTGMTFNASLTFNLYIFSTCL